MISVGIRELKNNLSRYVRQIEAGDRAAVTAHGRVVAQIAPSRPNRGVRSSGRYDQLVASGVIEPAVEQGARLPAWPDIHLPAGTAARLIDRDRGET